MSDQLPIGAAELEEAKELAVRLVDAVDRAYAVVHVGPVNCDGCGEPGGAPRESTGAVLCDDCWAGLLREEEERDDLGTGTFEGKAP